MGFILLILLGIASLILTPNEEDEFSIRYVSELIKKAFEKESGKTLKMTFDSTSSDGQFKKTADNSLLKKHKKDLKFKDIEKGIEETVQWFVRNYSSARK